MSSFDRNVRPRWTPPTLSMPLTSRTPNYNVQSYAFVSVYITEVVRAWYHREASPVFLSFAVPTPFEALGPIIDDIKRDIARVLSEEYGTYVSGKCLQMFDSRGSHIPYTVTLRDVIVRAELRDDLSLAFYDQAARILRTDPQTVPLHGETPRPILHLRPV